MVFDHLVFDDAHLRFRDGGFGERDAGAVGGNGGGAKNGVDLGLGICCEQTLCFAQTVDGGVKCFDRGDWCAAVRHRDPLLCA